MNEVSRRASDFGGRLLYSQAWEDVVCARAALHIQLGQTVLAIGAAGDNVLALLLDAPARLIAIDSNPAQTALIEFKAAAVRSLPPVAVAPLVGVGGAGSRLDGYARLRPRLTPAAARFWDDHPALIRAGVIHTGRFERYLALFRRLVLSIVPGRAALRAMLAAPDLATQRRVYATAWDSAAWRGLFRLFFSRPLLSALGRHPDFFRHCVVPDLGRHYLERCRHGLTEVPLPDNPYVAYMIAGTYDRPERLPPYLQPAALDRLPSLLDRLTIETVDLAAALAVLPAHSVDAFYLSDVFELFDSADYEAMLEEIARVGRPGARLCYWNNLVERHRPPRLAECLASHDDLAAALYQRDRVFIYSRFVVESVRSVAARRGDDHDGTDAGHTHVAAAPEARSVREPVA